MDNNNYFRPGKKCGNWDTAVVKAVLHLRSEECTTFTAMLLTLSQVLSVSCCKKSNTITVQTKGLQTIIHGNYSVLLFWQLTNEKVWPILSLKPFAIYDYKMYHFYKEEFVSGFMLYAKDVLHFNKVRQKNKQSHLLIEYLQGSCSILY